jgi:hypothetical protein
MRMSEALVGAMVAAMRRTNRERADAARSTQPAAVPRSEGAAWGYLVHPALMPTVYSPNDTASDDAPAPDGPAVPWGRHAERGVAGEPASGSPAEEVAARKV